MKCLFLKDLDAGRNEDNLFMRNKEVMKYMAGDTVSRWTAEEQALSH